MGDRNRQGAPAATPKKVVSQAGFSYIGVLVITAITGIAAAGVSQVWSTAVRRSLEAELLYRGDSIRQAIASYHNASGNAPQGGYPMRLEDLLRDPRFPGVVRHLRKPYADPFTGKADWVWIREASGGIRGLHSSHAGVPRKTAGFPKPYKIFEKAKTYRDWQFLFVPGAEPGGTN